MSTDDDIIIYGCFQPILLFIHIYSSFDFQMFERFHGISI